MTLRLTVHRAAWLQHVETTLAAYGNRIVPVVKGNGYGFGRAVLHDLLRARGGSVAVGTIHELHDVPSALSPIVLTPALERPAIERPITCTVGALEHVAALSGWHGPVMVKLASSMHRYGVSPDDLAALLDAVRAAGHEVAAFALHLPLAGTDDDRLAEVDAWLPHLPGGSLWVSHLTPESVHGLAARVPSRDIRVRVGTALWHGVPRGEFAHLGAVVVQTDRVRAGDRVGYHGAVVPADGSLVCVGAGSSHGIATLPAVDDAGPRSPFHFAHRRLPLLEPSHMHTSLCLVPDGQRTPRIGDVVDVQQPLINVRVDELEWRP